MEPDKTENTNSLKSLMKKLMNEDFAKDSPSRVWGRAALVHDMNEYAQADIDMLMSVKKFMSSIPPEEEFGMGSSSEKETAKPEKALRLPNPLTRMRLV